MDGQEFSEERFDVAHVAGIARCHSTGTAASKGRTTGLARANEYCEAGTGLGTVCRRLVLHACSLYLSDILPDLTFLVGCSSATLYAEAPESSR